MKKLLEYRVFDLLKDPDNEKFLSKVKTENPDLYVQFTSYYSNPAHPVVEANIIKLRGPHLPSGKPSLTPKERRSERVFDTTGRVTYTFNNG